MFANALRCFRKDYLSITLGIKLAAFVIFLRSFGWGFVDPYFSIYLKQFHDNYTLVGFFVSLMSVSALLAILPLLRVTDRMRERVIIKDGELLYLVSILGYVVAGLFKSIPLLLLVLFFHGMAITFVAVGTEAYIRKHNVKGKTGPFAYYVAMDYCGWVLGMLIAAFTVQYYSLNSMFLFVVPGVLASLFILPHIRERGISSFFRAVRRCFRTRQDITGLFQDARSLSPKMVFFFILAFFDGAIRMCTLVFIPLLALTIEMDLRSIALLMAVMYMPFIFSFFISELTDRLRQMHVIAAGLFIGALSFILLYFIVHQVWIMVLAAAISLSMAIIRPAYNGAITRLTPRRMLGEVTGYNNFVERIGRITGPVLMGVIADFYSLQIAFLLIALVAFGLGSLSLIFRGYDYLVNPD